MRLRTVAAAAAITLAVGTAAVASARALVSSFVAAPAGVAIAHRPLLLPDVQFATTLPLPSARIGGTLGPTAEQLLQESYVVTDEQQWRSLWRTLFGVPFDPTLVDFDSEFVVLVGGGSLSQASFGMSSVEVVDAEWTMPGFFGGPLPGPLTEVNGFLAVTATTVFAGAAQFPPPPHTWRVAATAIDRAEYDDVVVQRASVFAP